MKLLKIIAFPFLYIINIFKKLNRRIIIAKASKKMEKVFQKQLAARRELRKDVNVFLREYFGIDANSKYIPPDFKNAEEVKTAVVTRFNLRMKELNVNYTDMFN